MDPNLVPLVSVVSSALLALVASFVGPLISDWARWKREIETRRFDDIDTHTRAVLSNLARFQSAQVSLTPVSPEGRAAYSDLLGSYYSWEQILWGSLPKQHRCRLSELRSRITVDIDVINQKTTWEVARAIMTVAPEVATTILDLARLAHDKRRSWSSMR